MTPIRFLLPTPRELTLILFAAVGYFLAFPNPFIQVPLSGLFMPASILLLSMEAGSRTRALFYSFLCMCLGSSFALYWLAIPMHNFAGVPWVIGALFVLLLGVYYGLYGLFFSLLLRFFTRQLNLFAALLACATSWGALELFRGYFLTGFPWLSLSSAFAGWPVLAQGGAVLGMYGLSALYALIALLLAAAILPVSISKTEKPYKLLLPALGLLLCIIGYGANRLAIQWENHGEAFLAAMVQGSISQKQKWTLENRSYTVKRYLELSRQALDMVENKYERKADLLIWPETAIPFVYELSPTLAEPIRNFVAASATPLLFGLIGMEAYNSTYNRILLLDQYAQRSGHYDKEHLVPFGEYIPPDLYVPFATEFLQGTGFSQGKNEHALWLPANRQTVPSNNSQDSAFDVRPAPIAPTPIAPIVIGPLICYEVIFPELAQRRVEQNSSILVSVSNDAWFEFSSAPVQHLQLAAMRCIEQGRYMLRSTNTGISAVIDPTGRILDGSPLFQPWVQAASVRTLEEKTLYHKGYAWITPSLWFIPLVLFIWAVYRAVSGRKPHTSM